MKLEEFNSVKKLNDWGTPQKASEIAEIVLNEKFTVNPDAKISVYVAGIIEQPTDHYHSLLYAPVANKKTNELIGRSSIPISYVESYKTLEKLD